jgi:hypothetical protein
LDDGLHIDDRLDLIAVAKRPVEAESRAPIVHDQNDVRGQVQRIEPRIEIARVVDETVRARRRPSGLPHADQIRSQAAPALLDMGNDVAPKK